MHLLGGWATNSKLYRVKRAEDSDFRVYNKAFLLVFWSFAVSFYKNILLRNLNDTI